MSETGPSIPTRWNYVVQAIVDPCDAPWTIYLKAFFQALLEAIIWWFAFDLYQIMSSSFRPRHAYKWIRSGRKGGKGTKAGRIKNRSVLRKYLTGALTFDPWSEVGKRLPHAEFFRGRKVGMGEATFWIAEGAVQRLFFYWAVAEVTTQFFYRWSSLVVRSRYCEASRIAQILSEDTTDNVLIGTTPVTLSNDNLLKIRGGFVYNPAGCSTTEHTGSIGACVNVYEFPPAGGTFTLEIYRNAYAPENRVAAASITGAGGVGASAAITGPGTYIVILQGSGGTFRYHEGVFYGTGAPLRGPLR